jgi:predicted dehydrogenase
MRSEQTRRDFMKSTAVGSVAAGTLAKQVRGQTGADRPLRLGFVGVGDRGSYHLDIALGIEGLEVPALCDINDSYLYRARRWVEESGRPSPTLYGKTETDFERLCEEEDLDCVICCTSWEWHAPCCLSAMRNDKHAVSEVPIILTLDEAWEIVETWEKTGKWATLALEGLGNLALLNLVQKGLLGKIIHAEGGYIHDLRLVKFDPEREPWRLQHSVERNGNLYPDHPMRYMIFHLDINHGDRIDYLVSMSSSAQMLNEYAAHYYGKDHPYAKMQMAQGDYNASLIRTVNGKMITLNFDTNTPHPRGMHRIQGTKGVYFQARGVGEPVIYLDGRSPESHQWEPAAPYLKEYEHPVVANYSPPPRRAVRGHGGGETRTPLTWHRLVTALREGRMPDWDVYDSVTSSAVSPLTEMSVAGGSKPVEFPDFTRGKWKNSGPIEVV